MYSYLFFTSLNHTHGSALQGLNPSCSMMSWILCDHLKPELFKPYRAWWITNICLVVLQILPQLLCIIFLLWWFLGMHCQCLLPRLPCCSIRLGTLKVLRILLRLLQNRCYLLDQEIRDHLLLVWLCSIHHVYMME